MDSKCSIRRILKIQSIHFVTSAKEVLFLPGFVCEFV